MTNIRLLPVVVLAISALLVLKTLGLVTNGGYVLTGISTAQAAGGGSGGGSGAEAPLEVPSEPTLEDTSPTIGDTAPTLPGPEGAEAPAAKGSDGAPAPAAEAGEYGAPADAAAPAPAPAPAEGAMSDTFCVDSNVALAEDGTAVPMVTPEGEPNPSFAQSMTADCLPSGDAVPMQVKSDGTVGPLLNVDGTTPTEQQLLQRLADRRAELEKYEQDLAMRASLVDAAEQRIEERAATLAALEAQIAGLVDQRTAMESGQFAGIVAMYEAMKPKDAANIFNNLEMDVLLRVAKAMSPRKMAPILAEMQASRAQELTVKLATASAEPTEVMTPEDLAALPQIVGQ